MVELVRERARVIDAVLVDLWNEHLAESQCALAAVGGYGRGELHPASDVDILILVPDTLHADDEASLTAFVTALWDIGLEIGHSVRTVADCESTAKSDLTIVTSLMESRHLVGPTELFAGMRAVIATENMWPARQFFEEKRKEQIARHHRYHDTAYNLEPNVKGESGRFTGYPGNRLGCETTIRCTDPRRPG